MEQIRYTSIDRIFSRVIRDLGVDNVNESDLVEWSGEALEAIGAVSAYEETVAFIEVKNHQIELPAGFHSLIQVARNHCYNGPEDKSLICPSNVVEKIIAEEPARMINPCNCDNAHSCDCNGTRVDYTLLDCNGTPITGYDIAYYRPYFDLQYEYYQWNSNSFYKNCYSPIRLSNNSFFNSIVCEEEDKSIYLNSIDEYTIVRGEVLRFSFKEGSVALSFLKQSVDAETGYPMVPDHYSYVTAIIKYITLRIMERDFYAGREGAQGRMQKAEADWHWYCKQAGNYALMPKGIDQWQNISDARNYILPKRNSYNNFFGKLSRPENRKWNDPNNRNR